MRTPADGTGYRGRERGLFADVHYGRPLSCIMVRVIYDSVLTEIVI